MNPRRTIGRRKTDRFRFAAGMGFALCLAGLILQLSRCNTGTTVTGPEKTPEVSTPSTQPAATTPTTPTPVADPTTTPDHECSVGKNGSFSITNKSSIIQQYAAWWTDFDDQETVRGTHGPFQFQPGDSMIGSFNKQCIQVDVGQTINGTPFCFGFIDKEGNTFVPSRAPDKVAACRTKPCVEKWSEQEPEFGEWEVDPEPTPSTAEGCFRYERRKRIVREQNSCTLATRVKSETWEKRAVQIDCCEEEWIAQPPTRELGEWGACEPIREGVCQKARTVTITVYEINSCTEEKRIKTQRTETLVQPCECPCVPTFTTRTVDDWGPWTNVAGSCGHRAGLHTIFTLNSCTKQETSTTEPLSEDKDCPFCHVSANGQPETANDFDVDIQTTQFNYPYPAGNPGHNSHLLPADHCPQDYWGVCDPQFAFSEILGIVCKKTNSEGACTKFEYTCVPVVQ